MANSNVKSVGGQALIEGVMMRGTKDVAMAIRKPDKTIEIKREPVSGIVQKYKLNKIPLLRGAVALVDAMVLGVRSLMYSAEIAEEGIDTSEPDKFEKFMRKVFKDKADDALIYISVFFALALSIGIFFLLPTLVSGFLRNYIERGFVLSLFEGVLRLSMFIIYVILVSKMDEMRRVFQYHGAEHKAIYCYENGEGLTIENAKKYTTLHPRCGTSFIFIVMMVSIIVFSFISWESPFMRMGLRLALLPVVAGISFEIIKLAGKRSESPLMKLVSYPGLMMQRLTTVEPDDEQLEVALEALKNVIDDEDIVIL